MLDKVHFGLCGELGNSDLCLEDVFVAVNWA
jgi:hypothetical protein